MLERNVEAHLERIEEISAQASGEATIEATLNEIIKLWLETKFKVVGYRDTKDRFIIAEVDEIITQLEDHSMSVQTMTGSKFVNDIRAKVEEWEKKLGTISDVIDEWLTF